VADEAVSVEIEPGEPAAEGIPAAAAAAVATATAAAALAQETTAHAELQAAEEVGEVKDEVEEWRRETALLGAALATTNERLDSLTSLEAERHTRLDAHEENIRSILSRLEESREPEPPRATAEPPEENLLTEPEAAAAAANPPAEAAKPERRRAHRWI